MLWWPELGFIALLLALCVSLLTALLSLAGGAPWAQRLPALCPRRWSLAQLALTAAGFALLLLALLADDFSLRYVAQHSHSALARGLKLAAAWGGHEGSLLLWLLCLAGWSALYAQCARRQAAQANAYTLGLMALIVGAFLLFIVTLGDPFARQFPAPPEGRDLNPMLQHPGLIFHPPLLYLGYGGLALCAARLLAGLLARQTAQAMADGCWRWLLPAWGCLSAGIILGSWWAYSELGWGGFWFSGSGGKRLAVALAERDGAAAQPECHSAQRRAGALVAAAGADVADLYPDGYADRALRRFAVGACLRSGRGAGAGVVAAVRWPFRRCPDAVRPVCGAADAGDSVGLPTAAGDPVAVQRRGADRADRNAVSHAVRPAGLGADFGGGALL